MTRGRQRFNQGADAVNGPTNSHRRPRRIARITVDLNSGYARVFQEMMAAGWNSTAVRDAVRELIGGWTRVLTEAAQQGPKPAPTSGRFRRRK